MSTSTTPQRGPVLPPSSLENESDAQEAAVEPTASSPAPAPADSDSAPASPSVALTVDMGDDGDDGGGGGGGSTSQLLPKQKVILDQMICSLVKMEVTADIRRSSQKRWRAISRVAELLDKPNSLLATTLFRAHVQVPTTARMKRSLERRVKARGPQVISRQRQPIPIGIRRSSLTNAAGLRAGQPAHLQQLDPVARLSHVQMCALRSAWKKNLVVSSNEVVLAALAKTTVEQIRHWNTGSSGPFSRVSMPSDFLFDDEMKQKILVLAAETVAFTMCFDSTEFIARIAEVTLLRARMFWEKWRRDHPSVTLSKNLMKTILPPPPSPPPPPPAAAAAAAAATAARKPPPPRNKLLDDILRRARPPTVPPPPPPLPHKAADNAELVAAAMVAAASAKPPAGNRVEDTAATAAADDGVPGPPPPDVPLHLRAMINNKRKRQRDAEMATFGVPLPRRPRTSGFVLTGSAESDRLADFARKRAAEQAMEHKNQVQRFGTGSLVPGNPDPLTRDGTFVARFVDIGANQRDEIEVENEMYSNFFDEVPQVVPASVRTPAPGLPRYLLNSDLVKPPETPPPPPGTPIGAVPLSPGHVPTNRVVRPAADVAAAAASATRDKYAHFARAQSNLLSTMHKKGLKHLSTQYMYPSNAAGVPVDPADVRPPPGTPPPLGLRPAAVPHAPPFMPAVAAAAAGVHPAGVGRTPFPPQQGHHLRNAAGEFPPPPPANPPVGPRPRQSSLFPQQAPIQHIPVGVSSQPPPPPPASRLFDPLTITQMRIRGSPPHFHQNVVPPQQRVPAGVRGSYPHPHHIRAPVAAADPNPPPPPQTPIQHSPFYGGSRARQLAAAAVMEAYGPGYPPGTPHVAPGHLAPPPEAPPLRPSVSMNRPPPPPKPHQQPPVIASRPPHPPAPPAFAAEAIRPGTLAAHALQYDAQLPNVQRSMRSNLPPTATAADASDVPVPVPVVPPRRPSPDAAFVFGIRSPSSNAPKKFAFPKLARNAQRPATRVQPAQQQQKQQQQSHASSTPPPPQPQPEKLTLRPPPAGHHVAPTPPPPAGPSRQPPRSSSSSSSSAGAVPPPPPPGATAAKRGAPSSAASAASAAPQGCPTAVKVSPTLEGVAVGGMPGIPPPPGKSDTQHGGIPFGKQEVPESPGTTAQSDSSRQDQSQHASGATSDVPPPPVPSSQAVVSSTHDARPSVSPPPPPPSLSVNEAGDEAVNDIRVGVADTMMSPVSGNTSTSSFSLQAPYASLTPNGPPTTQPSHGIDAYAHTAISSSSASDRSSSSSSMMMRMPPAAVVAALKRRNKHEQALHKFRKHRFKKNIGAALRACFKHVNKLGDGAHGFFVALAGGNEALVAKHLDKFEQGTADSDNGSDDERADGSQQQDDADSDAAAEMANGGGVVGVGKQARGRHHTPQQRAVLRCAFDADMFEVGCPNPVGYMAKLGLVTGLDREAILRWSRYERARIIPKKFAGDYGGRGSRRDDIAMTKEMARFLAVTAPARGGAGRGGGGDGVALPGSSSVVANGGPRSTSSSSSYIARKSALARPGVPTHMNGEPGFAGGGIHTPNSAPNPTRRSSRLSARKAARRRSGGVSSDSDSNSGDENASRDSDGGMSLLVLDSGGGNDSGDTKANAAPAPPPSPPRKRKLVLRGVVTESSDDSDDGACSPSRGRRPKRPRRL